MSASHRHHRAQKPAGPPPRHENEKAAAPAPPPRDAKSPPPERIGEILKREREKRGWDLPPIAENLCIRYDFLKAIEDGRYDRLPADAYAIGFVRSYAGLLELDVGRVVLHYQKEMAGRRRKPELSLPTPIAEGRTPSAAILVSAAVAAIVIYALWYGLASSGRTEVSTPPPLPAVAAMAPAAPASPPALSVAAPAAAANPGAPLSLLPKTAATPAPASTPMSAPTATSPTVAAAPAPVPPATATAPAAIAPAPAVAAKTDAVTPATAAVPASAEKTADAQKSPDAKPADANTGATTPPAADSHIFGDTGGDSRVSIKVEKESWILIADQDGRTVFDKVLKPGDVYRVPNKEGLTLTAGNGGGIVLTLDGKILPKLVSSDLVVRDVSLDPDDLGDQADPAP